MIKKLKNYLTTPYFFNPNFIFKFKVSFLFGSFVFLFLYIFQPFYISFYPEIIFEFTLGIGIITFIGILFFLTLSPIVFKRYFNEDNWTIGKNIFFILIGILFISSAIYYFGETVKTPYNYKRLNYFQYLFYSVLVSIMPCVFFITYNEKLTSTKRSLKATKIIKERVLPEKIVSNTIKIYAQNNKESLEFDGKDLIYITSNGNYASFYLKNGDCVTEKIIRTTLAKLESELNDFSSAFIKCHKSYIINSNYIKDIKGNARGYLITLKNITFDIPVSRNFTKQSLHHLLS